MRKTGIPTSALVQSERLDVCCAACTFRAMQSEIVAVIDRETFANPPWQGNRAKTLIRADPAMIESWAGSRPHAMPTRLMLQVGAIREEMLLRLFQNAASQSCHLMLLFRSDDHGVASMLRLLAIAPAHCLIACSSIPAMYECPLPSDTRVPVRALVVRALATRLSRLPPRAMTTSTVALLRSTPLSSPLQAQAAPTIRMLARRLAEVGLASPGRLHRASRLGFAWDFLRDNQVSRSRLAQTSGFASERTLCAAAIEILTMSLRESTFALDDMTVVDRLVAHCLRN